MSWRYPRVPRRRYGVCASTISGGYLVRHLERKRQEAAELARALTHAPVVELRNYAVARSEAALDAAIRADRFPPLPLRLVATGTMA